jgi:hypothetical protein
VIYVGIDDTDVIGSPGTNQLARAILKRLGSAAEGAVICRHQLFFDRRVPYTSKNGSASIVLLRADAGSATSLIDTIRGVMREWFVEGSDPGLCLTATVPDAVQAFGRRCQQEVVQQDDARRLAATLGVHLEGLGGTEQGVIGALAAIGLAASQEDGRVVHRSDWPYPDEFCGPQPVAAVLARGVDEIREMASGAPVMSGAIDIGKHLRPNVRRGRIVLFVAPSEDRTAAAWQAVKLT